MKIVTLVLVALLLTACGTTRSTVDLTSEHYLPPIQRIKIEAVEIRLPTSTVAVGIVTQDGRVVGVVPGNARPLIDIPLSILQSAATVSGAAFMGQAIKSGLKSIESITPAE